MSLDFLPAELILDIVERLDPSSALSFALTSRAHFRLLKDKLWQHAKLSATYSTIRPTNDGHLIWEVTKEILQDPCKGWYVRDLDLGTNRPSEYENMPEEDRGLFKAAIEKIMPLYPYAPGFFAGDTDSTDLSDKMDDDLRSGFEGCILVLLIHHSPQLRMIRMTDNMKSWTFELFIHWVAAAYQDPSLAPQMPLQHLRLAAIAHHDPESFCTVDWAVNFLCIPSLKTFAAFMMGSEGAHMYGEEYEAALRMSTITPVSNVEELFFQGCAFDANSFDTILPLIKDLKRFTYNAGDYTVPGGRYDTHLYNGKKVIKALVNHAANSLEELNLVDISAGYVDGEDDVSFVSARGFKKLKALHCELGWLLHDPNDISTDGSSSKDHHSMDDFDEVGLAYLKDPRDNLPKSLEYLYLDIHNKREFEELVKIFETSNANTPKLTLESSCIERFNKSTKYGRAVGPQVQFANPLFDDIWRGHSYFV